MAPPPPTARNVALLLLEKILYGGADMAWLIDHEPKFASLSVEDRRFCYLLVMTALRWQGVHNKILKAYMKRPLAGKFRAVPLILSLGLAQRQAGVPEHALVHTAVELAKEGGFVGHTGLINAVLRATERDKALEKPELMAPIHNLPTEFRKRWENFYGREATAAIAQAITEEPPTDLQVKENPEQWAATLEAALPLPDVVRLSSARALTGLAGFSEGAWWVQDVAASLPARLLGDVKGKKVLDACAAPGGKTAQLCNYGANVTAVEKSATRVRVLQENMQRLQFTPEIVTADALKFQPGQVYDGILLDAPCTSTGTLRRNPDIAWKRKPRDIEEQAGIQKALLAHLWTLLKPGGVMVYSVCSLEPEEGEMQVSAFLEAQEDAALEPVVAGEADIAPEWITARGELRTLPSYLAGQGGMDGFFAARLRKKLS